MSRKNQELFFYIKIKQTAKTPTLTLTAS